MTIETAISRVIPLVLEKRNQSATLYLSPKLRVKATHRLFDKQTSVNEVLVTVGRPNYAERKFVKIARRAGEPFPIKRPQIKPFKRQG